MSKKRIERLKRRLAQLSLDGMNARAYLQQKKLAYQLLRAQRRLNELEKALQEEEEAAD